MTGKARTVKEYLAGLPADRRAALERVRGVILDNIDKDYEEGMQYGMIGYYVPHRVFPGGYHCDPKQPLPFAGLASQKNHMSLYLMGIYCGCGTDGRGGSPVAEWFRREWAKTGKKMDIGKACIRFRTIEDLPLELIGRAIARLPAKKYVAYYEAALRQRAGGKAGAGRKKK
jgi:hypothetical protein